MTETNGEAKIESGGEVGDKEGVDLKKGGDESAQSGGVKKSGKTKKDWLAVGGIGIEKRRRSSTASYRIENNKVLIDTADGVKELEIVASKEKHGSLRKAVPALPVPLAIICLILNIIPGLGTLLSGLAVLCCGYKTEHETKGAGFRWNLLAAFLQLVLSPILVGLIWSMQRGVLLIQESLSKKIEEREAAVNETA